jgi:hypothetical protein
VFSYGVRRMVRKKDTMVYMKLFLSRHSLRKLYAVIAMHGSNNVGSYGSNNLKGGCNELDYHDHSL